jgi:hypothetical protein
LVGFRLQDISSGLHGGAPRLKQPDAPTVRAFLRTVEGPTCLVRCLELSQCGSEFGSQQRGA